MMTCLILILLMRDICCKGKYSMDYSGLWEIMTNKNMTNAELMRTAHISSKTIWKMKQGE